MHIKTKGLVIKQRNIGDNDKIITILSHDLGVIEFSAKNINSRKNSNTSSCQLLNYSEFCLYKGKNHYILNSSFSINQHYKLREDVKKLALACYFCDIINHISHHENISDILSLILNCFYIMENDKKDLDLLKAIFEMRIMVLSGFSPNLIGCKECNSFLCDEYIFYINKGYILCKECALKEQIRNSITYTLYKPVFLALRHIIYSTKEKLFSFDLKDASKEQLMIITQNYILLYVEKIILKSLSIYNSL